MFPNKPNTTGTGGVFQTQFFRNLIQNLPYKTGVVEDTIQQMNPKYQEFKKGAIARETALRRNSITQNLGINGRDLDATAQIFVSKANTFINNGADEQKMNRIKDWKVIQSYAEMADALDEIINEMFNPDDTGRVQELHVRGVELEDMHREELDREFDRYISYFDFLNEGERYGRQFLVTGELFFEHVIHMDYIEDGILGVVQIPQELIDPVYTNLWTEEIESYIVKKPIFDVEQPNVIARYDVIPLEKNQVVYINSEHWNAEKTCKLPHIELARRAWRQLSLIEDSIIIYRLVRAPEKLVFNIDVGNMAKPAAESYLAQVSRDYWSRKAIDPNTGEITQKYAPQSMLDTFFFPKRTGSEGSSVSTVGGGQNLGELQDLQYFAQKLYKSLRVPVSRLQSDNTYRDGTDILREELKFSQFIQSIQRKFAKAIKRGFMIHIELCGLKKKMNIREHHIDIHFNPPTNFQELRESKKLEQRMQNFNTITSNASISKTYAMMRYMKMKPEEVRTNREFLRQDAEQAWELKNIEQNGPKWAEIAASQQKQLVSGGGEGGPGGPGGGDLGGGGGGLGGLGDLGGGGDLGGDSGPGPFSPAGGESGGMSPGAGGETGSEELGGEKGEPTAPEEV